MPDSRSNEPINILFVTGLLDPASALTELHLPSGKIIRLPTELFEQEGPGTLSADTAVLPKVSQAASDAPIVVPVIEEQLELGRRTIETGVVRLQKTVQEVETQLDELLAVRTFDIERVILNKHVEAAPPVRQEGDTTIYPLVEEQLILTKQLMLKEELRVTRRDTERRDTQTVPLRREHITVERHNL